MSLPFFYVEDLDSKLLELNEETSKHMISVLRMQKGDQILLTDGKGTKAIAAIVDDNRKKGTVQLLSLESIPKNERKVAVGISLIKNTSRFEWFLEKATEIGVAEIIPLQCERTEKEKFRHDRMQNILVSAMLQSQQYWLPVLHEVTPFEKAIALPFDKRYIAHCEDSKKGSLQVVTLGGTSSQIILIGPEGDFTHSEIELALSNNFTPVSLGSTRLRTETAGMVAATLLCLS